MAIKYELEDAYNKHEHCELVIYWKQFADGTLRPGIFCKEYGIWIQWLDDSTAYDLIDNHHIEVVLEQPKKKPGHPKH